MNLRGLDWIPQKKTLRVNLDPATHEMIVHRSLHCPSLLEIVSRQSLWSAWTSSFSSLTSWHRPWIQVCLFPSWLDCLCESCLLFDLLAAWLDRLQTCSLQTCWLDFRFQEERQTKAPQSGKRVRSAQSIVRYEVLSQSVAREVSSIRWMRTTFIFSFKANRVHSFSSQNLISEKIDDSSKMTSSTPSLMDTLVSNAKYMPQNIESDRSKPSACELNCKTEQLAIKDCVTSIQGLREGKPQSPKDAQSCLAPAVSAWTKCCQDANEVRYHNLWTDSWSNWG